MIEKSTDIASLLRIDSVLYYHLKNKTKQYYNAKAVSCYILNGNLDEVINDTKINGQILGTFLSSGLIDELVSLYERFPSKSFIENNGINKFGFLFHNAGVLFCRDFKFISKFSSVDTKLLVNMYHDVSNNSLSRKIDIYAELFSRSHDYLDGSKTIEVINGLPLIRPFYECYLFKNRRREYIENFIGKDLLVAHLLLLNYLQEGIRLKLTRAVINSLYSLFPHDVAEEIINMNENTMDSTVRDVQYRVNNWMKYTRPLPMNGKAAIFLSGQFRGAESCLPFWFDFARKNGFPIFISTWDMAGIPKGAHGNRLQRLLPPILKSDFLGVSDNEFFSVYPSFKELLINPNVDNILMSLIKNNPDVDVKYIIHSEDEFNNRFNFKNLNQSKMFFNMNSVFDLCNDIFSYENVIWARPDLFVKEFSYEYIPDNEIRTSFTGEGAQCGDFIIQMNTSFTDVLRNLFNVTSNPFKTSYMNCYGPGIIGKYANYCGLYISRFGEHRFQTNGLKAIKFDQIKFYRVAKDLGLHYGTSQEKIDLINRLILSIRDEKESKLIKNTLKGLGVCKIEIEHLVSSLDNVIEV